MGKEVHPHGYMDATYHFPVRLGSMGEEESLLKWQYPFGASAVLIWLPGVGNPNCHHPSRE